jgi:hypothetical protein
MALADTAKVVVQMDLTGNFSSAIKAAEADVAKFGASAATGAVSAVGKLEQGFGRLGGALSHAKSQIGGLLTGPLGILGLGAGIFGLGSIIEGSLKKTSDFGLSLERLTSLTGESAQSMGELALVAGKFGIDFDRLSQIVGFTEKTLGKLQNTSAHVAAGNMTVAKATEEVTKAHEKLSLATIKLNTDEQKKHVSAVTLATDQVHLADAERALTKATSDLANAQANQGVQGLNKLQALQKQYGVVLTDSQGKALNFSTVLSHVADYYTSNASAANKAALAATVFGRGYAALIPVLALGSAGIAKSKQAIDDLGLSLGTDSITAMNAYKAALRNLGEAVDILQIQIGLALAPTITDLANTISLFLEHGGAKQIIQFFKDGANYARTFGKFLGDTVIPTLQGIASAAKAAWDGIPDPLKQLLIGGFVGNKVIKWTFGIDIAGTAVDAIKGAVAKGLGMGLLGAGIGKAFVQPVFVTNMIPGGLGGAASAAEGAGGIGVGEAAVGAGGVTIGALGAAAAAGLAAILGLVVLAKATGGLQPGADIQAGGARSRGGGSGAVGVNPRAIPSAGGGAPGAAAGLRAIENATLATADNTDRLQALQGQDNAYSAAIAQNTRAIDAVNQAQLSAFRAKWGDQKSLEQGIKARAEAAFHHQVSAAAVAATLARDLIKRAEIIDRSTRNNATKIAELKVLEHTALQHHDAKAAQQIAKQIATITAIHGTTAAVNALHTGINAIRNTAGGTAPGGGVRAPVHVNVGVSTRQVQAAQTTAARYGRVSNVYVPG